MTDITIPKEALEAAARAIASDDGWPLGWEAGKIPCQLFAMEFSTAAVNVADVNSFAHFDKAAFSPDFL